MTERIVVKTVDGVSHEVDIPAHTDCYFKNRVFNSLDDIQKTVELVGEAQELYELYLRRGFPCFLWTGVDRHHKAVAFIETCSKLVEGENAES